MDIVRQGYVSKRRRGFQAQFVIVPILILLLVGVGFWVHLLLSSEAGMKSLRQGNTHIQRVSAATYNVQDQAVAVGLAKQYMQAFLSAHYHEMWAMLSPQVQGQ